jgi:hypothetical protein
MYLQPILLETEQQGSPSPVQAGKVVSQRYLAAVPYAMADATTTPIGCHMLMREIRYRRFGGMNSRAMVASIGMFPPRPMLARK